MKPTPVLAGLLLLLLTTGCGVVTTDPGPTQTAKDEIDSGNAETVRAEIRMSAGELHLTGGGTKLIAGSFRYSEAIGRPAVRYDLAGSRGLLTVESPNKNSNIGRMVNEWTLQMGSQVPMDVNVNLGAGNADLDMSRLPLQSMDVHMGAGELQLNLAGKYKKDVNVQVNGGAGDAKIRLPKEMGAVVDAKLGVGGIDTKGLNKRDGKYYNDAYVERKPAVRLDVRSGVGGITLSVQD